MSLGFGGICAEFLASIFAPGSATLFLRRPRRRTGGSSSGSCRATRCRRSSPGGSAGTAPAIGEGGARGAGAGLRWRPRRSSRRRGSSSSRSIPSPCPGRAEAPASSPSTPSRKLGPLPEPLCVDGRGRVVNARAEARPVAKIDRLLAPASAAIDRRVGEVGQQRAHHPAQPAQERLRPLDDSTSSSRAPPRSTAAPACPTSPPCPRRWTSSSSSCPPPRRPTVLADLVEADKAESVIVIPGGFEEKAGTEAITARMRSALERSRSRPGRRAPHRRRQLPRRTLGPGQVQHALHPRAQAARRRAGLRSGGPDLPVRGLRDHEALQAPEPRARVRRSPAATRWTRPSGDFLERLAEDESIRLFAVYIEGFKPLDGAKVLRACGRITRHGPRGASSTARDEAPRARPPAPATRRASPATTP